jgi:hypothetical protein
MRKLKKKVKISSNRIKKKLKNKAFLEYFDLCKEKYIYINRLFYRIIR